MSPRHCSLALALALTACPAGPDAGKADPKQADAKKVDAKTTDAKKVDAKTEAKAPDAKTPDAKTPDAKVEPVAPTEPAAPAPLSVETEAAVASSINAFAIDLHHELAVRPGNLFVSPASISIAFAMTHAGAKGKTADELAKVFHFPASADLHAGFAGTLARWDAVAGGLELDIANRLFGEKTVTFEPSFLELTKTAFGAPLEPLDFNGAAGPSRDHINGWVATQTHDKIKDLLPPSGVTSATKLVLVNAIYFKAQWAEAFQDGSTADASFVGAKGKTTVKMMNRVDRYALGVAKDAKLRTLELPYDGGQYSMVIVLPDDPKGLPAVEKALTADALKSWIDGASSARVDLKLPRFRIEPGDALELRAPLERLGVVTAWGGDADFTGMAPASAQLQISEAFHKAFVAVDEAGTEAAAATAVSMKAGSAAPSDEPVPFVVDHPFLFLVRDTKTGAILFMGRLVDPA
ncbi:MAG: serpin family protein [Deltaproteobacteria bacterium]|nr:serpin family protein [Nannocystaceae bacterium]